MNVIVRKRKVALTRSQRIEIEDTIERLLEILDANSDDCDLEDGRDDEPWLGWPLHCDPSRIDASHPMECELDDCDLEPEGNDEPSLGWTVAGAHGDMRDLEKQDYP